MNPTTIHGNETWITPKHIIDALGVFDLDPCCPPQMPWETAKTRYTKAEDGLLSAWHGRVWLNPPYGKQLRHWLNKMGLHRNGIALTFGRTDTKAFHEYVFPVCESILFLKGRVKFCDIQGRPARSSGGAPSVLVSYTEQDSEAIHQSGLKGHHASMTPSLFVFSIHREDTRTWKLICGEALMKLDGTASLNELYDAVTEIAPAKVKRNRHYQAKVRQTLQYHYQRIESAVYSINP